MHTTTMSGCVWECLALSVLLFGVCHGAISTFSEDLLKENHYFSRTVPMYKQSDAPFDQSKQSYVQFDSNFITPRFLSFLKVQMQRDTEGQAQGTRENLEVVLFHSSVRNSIGKELDGINYLCCWKEPFEKGACTIPGQLIIQPSAYNVPDSLYEWKYRWGNSSDNTINLLDQQITIQKTGIWRMYIVHVCVFL